MLRKIGGELKDVDIKEVSFVDRPANQKRFLFVKDEAGIEKAITGIEIVTEGTQKASVSINGVEIEDLTSFYFYYEKPREDEGPCESFWPPVYAWYTVETDTDVGFAQTTKTLTKGEMNMENPQLIELAKQYGITLTSDMIEKSDKETLEAWDCISGFPIPAPLAKAMGVIIKQDMTEVQEQAAPVVAPTAKEIAEAVLLASATAEEPPATISDTEPKPETAVAKALAEQAAILTRLEKLETGEANSEEPKPGDGDAATDPPSAELKALQTQNADLMARLEVVEKSTGVVKTLGDPPGRQTEEVDDYSSIDLGLA